MTGVGAVARRCQALLHGRQRGDAIDGAFGLDLDVGADIAGLDSSHQGREPLLSAKVADQKLGQHLLVCRRIIAELGQQGNDAPLQALAQIRRAGAVAEQIGGVGDDVLLAEIIARQKGRQSRAGDVQMLRCRRRPGRWKCLLLKLALLGFLDVLAGVVGRARVAAIRPRNLVAVQIARRWDRSMPDRPGRRPGGRRSPVAASGFAAGPA
jgi:hypothetical protein